MSHLYLETVSFQIHGTLYEEEAPWAYWREGKPKIPYRFWKKIVKVSLLVTLLLLSLALPLICLCLPVLTLALLSLASLALAHPTQNIKINNICKNSDIGKNQQNWQI